MKRFYLLLAALLAAPVVHAEGGVTEQVIESETHCVSNGGISIGLEEDEGAKVACMESKAVQNVCGPDGRLTRLQAFKTWYAKLQQFQNTCTTKGGTFAFQDPNFVEPQDESYCLQAIPEIGSNMFEEPLCNYRSLCPAVTVTCDQPHVEHTVASLN